MKPDAAIKEVSEHKSVRDILHSDVTWSHTPALREAAASSDARPDSATKHLPELKIDLDDKIEYFAKHSLTVDIGRRIAYDIEQKPDVAKAYWGGEAALIGLTAAAFAMTKNPALLGMRLPISPALSPAANFYATESANLAGLTGIAGGATLQHFFVATHLQNELPSKKLAPFKAIDLSK